MSGLIGLAAGSIALVVAACKWIAPGDAKLMMAVGALMGAPYVGWAALFGGAAGGVMALAVLAKRGMLRRWATSTATAWALRLPASTLWTERAGYLPYSIPIAIGCALAGFYPL